MIRQSAQAGPPHKGGGSEGCLQGGSFFWSLKYRRATGRTVARCAESGMRDRNALRNVRGIGDAWDGSPESESESMICVDGSRRTATRFEVKTYREPRAPTYAKRQSSNDTGSVQSLRGLNVNVNGSRLAGRNKPLPHSSTPLLGTQELMSSHVRQYMY